MKPAMKIVFVIALLFLSACAPAATPPPAPTDTPVLPTATAVPLSQQVTLASSDNTETNQDPAYTINTKIPVLTGSDDARVAAFNTLIASIVQKTVDDFKASIVELQPLPDLGGAGSLFDLRYEDVSAPGNVISLKLVMEGYVVGMAHPWHVTRTVNFDVEQGAEVALDSLFMPGSDYLTVIANYCTTELSKRDIGFGDIFAQGAAPAPENYLAWNITADGLLITFNEYQVAPYAAGPQTVTVPYAELAALIDPQGPLAGFLP